MCELLVYWDGNGELEFDLDCSTVGALCRAVSGAYWSLFTLSAHVERRESRDIDGAQACRLSGSRGCVGDRVNRALSSSYLWLVTS